MSRTSILVAGLMLFGLSLPLALRLVPMNKVYGFRTAISMKSDENWYAVNAVGGRRLALWALPIIVLGAAGWFIPEHYREAYARYSPFLVFGLVAIALISVGMWSRRHLP